MLQQELADEGHDVSFVGLNSVSAVADQPALAALCSFPLLQDTEEEDAWGLHEGGKDDFFVYDADGNLFAYLPIAGPDSTDLTSDEGHDHVKGVILQALGVVPGH